MAGYSSTPLPRKLGLREGHRAALIHAPAGFVDLLEPLPAGVVFGDLEPGACDLIVLFAADRATLERDLPRAKEALTWSGGLWLAWPKRASGATTDLNEAVVRETGLASGLVDNKVCAVDDRWSGLRFVYRLADRPPR